MRCCLLLSVAAGGCWDDDDGEGEGDDPDPDPFSIDRLEEALDQIKGRDVVTVVVIDSIY